MNRLGLGMLALTGVITSLILAGCNSLSTQTNTTNPQSHEYWQALIQTDDPQQKAIGVVELLKRNQFEPVWEQIDFQATVDALGHTDVFKSTQMPAQDRLALVQQQAFLLQYICPTDDTQWQFIRQQPSGANVDSPRTRLWFRLQQLSKTHWCAIDIGPANQSALRILSIKNGVSNLTLQALIIDHLTTTAKQQPITSIQRYRVDTEHLLTGSPLWAAHQYTHSPLFDPLLLLQSSQSLLPSLQSSQTKELHPLVQWLAQINPQHPPAAEPAFQKLVEHIGDPGFESLWRSQAALMLGQGKQAMQQAYQGLLKAADFRALYFALLAGALLSNDDTTAVLTLDVIRQHWSMSLSKEHLQRYPGGAAFTQSAAYQQWLKTL